jgi:hypothetical protein
MNDGMRNGRRAAKQAKAIARKYERNGEVPKGRDKAKLLYGASRMAKHSLRSEGDNEDSYEDD